MIVWTTDTEMTPAQAAQSKARAQTLADIVWDAMVEAGSAGLTTHDLQVLAGPSAVRRLFDAARAHEATYTKTYEGSDSWRYVLDVTTAPQAPTGPTAATAPQVRGIPEAPEPPTPTGWLF